MKNIKKALIKVLVLLLIVIVVLIVFLKVKENKNTDKQIDNNSDVITQDDKIDEITIVGSYKGSIFNDKMGDYDEIELMMFDDGTYFKSICSNSCTGYEGTYIIEKNKIKFKQTKKYGEDVCYYDINITSNYSFENNEIKYNYNNKIITLSEAEYIDLYDVLSLIDSKDEFDNCDSNK